MLTPSSILKRDLVFEVDLYSASPEELYEVPGIDEETMKLIAEGRTIADSFEKFVALSKKHKAVFAENIEFSVGRLGRKKMALTYKGTAINKFSYKILMKKKKKLEKKAIKIDNVENEKEKVDPENVSDLAAESEKDESDERSLTINEDETISADEDQTISADEDLTITADEDQTVTADEVETETENKDPKTIEQESKETAPENAEIRADNDSNEAGDSNEISASELRTDHDSVDTQDNIDVTENLTDRTVPRMAEVERESGTEVTSAPGAESVDCGQTENDDESPEKNGNNISDDARITGDTLLPESIQAGTEKESEENNNPGAQIVEPQRSHLEPESHAVSEYTKDDNDNLGEESIKDKLIEEGRFATKMSNEIIIEPVSGPGTSDDDEEDVNDEANFERLKSSVEPTLNFIEEISSNDDSDKENHEAYPNASEVSAAEVGHVLIGSDSANQDLEISNLTQEKSIEKELGSKKVTPLKLNISKRKHNRSQNPANQSTDEENTEPNLIKAKKKRKRRKIEKPKETSMKRQSTLDEHFPKKKASKDQVVENILPMKLFMKPVVRVERSKEVEDLLLLSNNNVSEKELDMSRITLHEFFNAEENDPRLEMIQIHRPLHFPNIRPPKQLERPLAKKFKCSACCEVFGSHKERAKHYHVHLTPGEASEIPIKKNIEYQCNLCKQCFGSFDEKREHYYGVHASKSTETSQEDIIIEANDNDIRMSPVVIEPPTSDPHPESLELGLKDSGHSAKTVEELLAEADTEPTQKYDVQQMLKTMEVIIDFHNKILFYT